MATKEGNGDESQKNLNMYISAVGAVCGEQTDAAAVPEVVEPSELERGGNDGGVVSDHLPPPMFDHESVFPSAPTQTQRLPSGIHPLEYLHSPTMSQWLSTNHGTVVQGCPYPYDTLPSQDAMKCLTPPSTSTPGVWNYSADNAYLNNGSSNFVPNAPCTPDFNYALRPN